MRDDEMYLLELALTQGAVTDKQASAIRDEVRMFPGQNVGSLMVRRQLITLDQLSALKRSSAAPQGHGPGAGSEGALAGSAASRMAAEGLQIEPMPRSAAATQAAPRPPARPAAVHPVFASSPSSPGTPSNSDSLSHLLTQARVEGASDFHLSPGRAPFIRKDGEIIYYPGEPLTSDKIGEMLLGVLDESQKQTLAEHLQLDCALEFPGDGRYRCNFYRQRLGFQGTFRIIRDHVPSFEELSLPPPLRKLTEYHQGLILVTGPAGCGKTTTVAAMLDLINRSRTDHIVTVEDPIEYVIAPKKCQVTQRQVGTHTASFATALRAALREDPDVMLVGEMRDLETITIATSAAETGHLVFGTLHTNSAARTVARIVDIYPPDQRDQICVMVSKSMRGVVTQQLIPRKDGRGRVLALEILIFTAAVAAQVMEGKTHQIASIIQTSKKIGMQLMDDVLMDYYRQGIITGNAAFQLAENKPLFEPIKDAK